MQSVCFDFTSGKTKETLLPRVIKRLENILKLENVSFDPETVNKFAALYYPDIRKMVNTLQMASKQNEMITTDVFNVERVNQELWDFILACNYNKAMKYVITNNYDFDELYGMMFKELIPLIPNTAKVDVISVIAESSVWSVQVAHKDLKFANTLLKIFRALREGNS